MQQEELYYQFKDQTQEQIESHIEQQIQNNSNQIKDDREWEDVLKLMKTQVMQLLKDKPKIAIIMNEQKSIEMTRFEAFTYLSLMYFELTQSQEDSNLQHKFNFLFDMRRLKNSQNRLATQKLNCIKCFLKIINQQPALKEQKIKITKFKLNLQNEFEWKSSQTPIAKFEFNNSQMFDFKNKNFVDFADPFIGGLCLDGMNCAQEEIIMCLHPEAIVSQLFFQVMEKDEAIYFENVLRICDFKGYEQIFQCIPIKQYEPRPECIIAIDAHCYGAEDQFAWKWIKRELDKAFTGFQVSKESDKDIVSGKWGCGVYRGNIMLKMLIQIAAFSEAVRENQAAEKPKLILTFFRDVDFSKYQEKLERIPQDYKTVGELVQYLLKIRNQQDNLQ